ncbi:MAG: hypothetical protein AAGB02_09470, partial [Pseudomonadota bacterium]
MQPSVFLRAALFASASLFLLTENLFAQDLPSLDAGTVDTEKAENSSDRSDGENTTAAIEPDERQDEKDEKEEKPDDPEDPQQRSSSTLPPKPIEEWDDRVSINGRLTPFGPDLLGDQIDPHLGGIVFQHTDVEIPGITHLEVAIRRRLSQGYNYQEGVNVEFGDWELIVPKMTTLTTQQIGWPAARCTNDYSVTYPQLLFQTSIIRPEKYSNGLIVSDARGKTRQVMENPPPGGKAPSNATHVTPDGWYFTCIGNIGAGNGGGQGFIAHAPNGDTYRFDRLVSNAYKPMGLLTSSGATLGRQKHVLFATEVTDVNGNWVRYDYDSSGRLTKIHANDGREITLGYSGASKLIRSVTANGRTWNYNYAQSTVDDEPIWISTTPEFNSSVLRTVVQPDYMRWQFNLDELIHEGWPGADCDQPFPKSVSLTHPYGMTGTFLLFEREHRIGRDVKTPKPNSATQTVQGCGGNFEPPPPGAPPPPEYIDMTMDTMSVTSKRISGPNVAEARWTYSYEQDCYTVGPTSNCENHTNTPYTEHTNETVVKDPDGNETVYEHFWSEGVHGLQYANQLAKMRVYDGLRSAGALIEERTFSYESVGLSGSSFRRIGITGKESLAHYQPAENVIKRGADWYKARYTYDDNTSSPSYSYGHPVFVDQWSNTSGDWPGRRTSELTYEHNTTKWILGLPTLERRRKNTTTTIDYEEHDYDSLGRRLWTDRFGKRVATFTYHPAGTLKYYDDGLNRRTELHNYKRGLPEYIRRPDNIVLTRTVDNNGWVTSNTDGRGNTTSYTYNTMGWLKSIVRPSPYSNTTVNYYALGGADMRQIFVRGNEQNIIYYDGMLRPHRTLRQPLANGGQGAHTTTTYDIFGRTTFDSYPSGTVHPTAGFYTDYDALGRPTSIEEKLSASDPAPFAVTTMDYQAGNGISTFDPEGNETLVVRQGFGSPDDGPVIAIGQSNIVLTLISRDLLGNPLVVGQAGNNSGYNVSATQTFIYDAHMRLCRHSVPETGDTLYQYDNADQRIGEARGQSAGSTCATTLPSADKITTTFDSLGRVDFVNYPGSQTPDIDYVYDNNSNLTKASRGGVVWDYKYTSANLLDEEKLSIDGRTYKTQYYYDAEGHRTGQTTPSGRLILWPRDGLGRATAVNTNWVNNHGTNIRYHPNGQLKEAAYQNGYKLDVAQNDRQLMQWKRVLKPGAPHAMLFTYAYDANARISAIGDWVTPSQSKNFTYDPLGRLKTASGAWGSGSFTYDPLGNLRKKTLGSASVEIDYNTDFQVKRFRDTREANV